MPTCFRRSLSVMALLAMVNATVLSAQITSGSITGSVRDTSGGVIPGATVTLISATRGTSTETTTNENGDFTFPNAPGDTYTVRVTMDGFKTIERPNVPLTPGERIVVPTLTIEVGALNETITVTGDAPLIQASTGERSFTVSSESVANLPIATRSYADFAALTPGVAGFLRLGGGGGNNVMQDGVTTMDTGGNPGSRGSVQMNPDAIAEVRILSQGYQAEYGRGSGLQISAISKSGTNQFRGSLYDVERNSDWNANSWVNTRNGDPKPVSKQRDFGYTIGGPVGKPGGNNKIFFFLAHELRPRETGGTITRFRVPTEAERRGDFSQSRDNNGNLFNLIRDASTGLPCTAADTRGCFQDAGVVGRIPQSRLYQTGLNILNLWPVPNASGTNYNYEAVAPEDNRLQQQIQIRADYQVSNKVRVMGKFATQRNTVKPRPGSIPGFNDDFQLYPFQDTGVTTVDYTISNTMFLEATYGFFQNWAGNGPLVGEKVNRFNSGVGDIPFLYQGSQVVDPRYFTHGYLETLNPPSWNNGELLLMPTFLWGQRVTNSGTRTATGAPAPPSLIFPGFLNINRTQDFSASVTKLHGAHTIKGGFFMNHSRKAQTLGVQGSFNFWGTLDFGQDPVNPLDTGFGFANAATGIFSSYTQQSKMLEGNYIYNNIEAYIQDNWKVTPRLTLDYGMRFTHQQPQYDSFLQASNFFADRWSASAAPLLYEAGCAAQPCTGNNRQALDPRTGELLGPATAAVIGAVVPGTGDPMNGIVRNGDGIAKENYEWPALVFGPRFGAAYDVRGDQRVVVRGAVGLFYDRPEGNSVFNQISNPPYSEAGTVRYGTLQNLGTGRLTQTPPTLFIFQYDAEIPSSLQWNVGTQFALPWASALDVSYVGQRGINLLRSQEATATGTNAIDINAVDFGAAFLPENQDPTLPASAVPGARAKSTDLLRPYQGLGAINIQWPRNYDLYHSLQTSFNRRFRNGLQFGLNYTLGLSYTGDVVTPLRLQHAADGSFSIRADQAEQDELMKQMPLRRHTIKGSFVWDMPDLDRSGGLKALSYVTNDWQLSGIFTAGSQLPYEITYSYQTGGENINLTGSPSYAARTVLTGDPGSGCRSDEYAQFDTSVFRGPTYGSLGLESGRNYMSGCVDKTVDLAVARNFPIGGGRNIQLRADVFNVFNAVVINSRVTQLQLTTPTEQAVRNSQFNADGTINAARVQPRNAGFGAANGAQDMRSVQIQLRFQF
jgi:hypothetical protein